MANLRPYFLLASALPALAVSDLWAQSSQSLSMGIEAETQKICESLAAIDASLSSRLKALGWVPVVVGDTTRFAGAITDGVVATMTGGPQDKKDWFSAFTDAGRFISYLITQANATDDVLMFMTSKPKVSALVVLPRDDLAAGAIHCLYSGAISPETDAYMNTLARLDERGGLAQANPELNIFHVQSLSNSADGDQTSSVLDIMYGRYTDNAGDMNSWQHAGSDYAFSLLRYSEEGA